MKHPFFVDSLFHSVETLHSDLLNIVPPLKMYLINKLVSLKSSSFKSQSNGQDLKRGGRKRVGVASAKSCLPRSAFGGDLATEDEVSSIASSSLKSFSISSSVGSVRSDRSSVPSSVVSVDVNRNEVVPPSAQQQAVGRGSGSVKSSKSWLKPSRKRNTSDSGSVLSTESDQSAVSTASSQLAEQQLDHLSNKIVSLQFSVLNPFKTDPVAD